MFDVDREPKILLINCKPGFEVPTIEQVRQWDREYRAMIKSQQPIVVPPDAYALMKKHGYIR